MRNVIRSFIVISFALLFCNAASAQMRQVYLDNVAGNEVYKLSFYSASEGYVAFRDWVGFTQDSGRTFSKKYITLGNVNFGNYNVNITFGFGISGVKAINQNTLIVYGDYGFVPAILYSVNGGSSYTLIFHSQYNPMQLSGGVMDMIFPENNGTGYATDADRILKTTNQGLTWSAVKIEPGSFYNRLMAVDNNTVFALCTDYVYNKLIKTTNGGTSWQTVTAPIIPGGKIISAFFLTATTGWISMYDSDNKYYFYKTTNGGSTWTLMNDTEATPFGTYKMHFTDVNTGFALVGQFTVYKTLNSGAVWEPLPRDNNYTYLGYSHNDMQCLTASQLWAGGGHGFLELSTNAGGTPLPKAYFRIDTTGLAATSIVNLLNYSRTGYTYKWFLNNTQISTSYNASYIHNVNRLRDTVKLVVSDGVKTDTVEKYQDFFQPVVVSSFTPTAGTTGTAVTITGINFNGASAVKFGGVPASNFTVVSSTQINAVVAAGATGAVTVTTYQGTGSLNGFTYFAPPNINLPTFISDSILCKAEPVLITIQNTQANVRYELIDSLNTVFGSVNSTGGTVGFNTSLISRTGHYKIRASRLNIASTSVFTNTIFILVEHTKSVFTANRVNIATGENVTFTNHSFESQSFLWLFQQDASITTAATPVVQNISYPTAGQKTLTLISTSGNGCRDTLTSNAVLVYTKPQPGLVCYAQNVADSDFAYYPESPAAMNKVLLADDNGYYISGFGNKPKLKSTIGATQNITTTSSAYFAKYTEDGVLSWFMSIPGYGRFSDVQKDSAGNIYVVGQCVFSRYLTFSNGDSVRIAATPADTVSYLNTLNGFVLKLDANGNYLWHTVISGYSYPAVWVPGSQDGAVPTGIKIVKKQIVISGSFLKSLTYCRNGVIQSLVTDANMSPLALNNFVLRIREDGSLVWHAYFENFATNQLRKIAGIGIDHSGGAYIAGSYEQKVILRDAAGTSFTLTSPGYGYNSYLMKVDSMGIYQWKAHYRNSEANAIFTDSLGNSYINGTGGNLQINNSDNTVTNVNTVGYKLLKFSPQGISKWAVGSVFAYYGYGYSVTVKGSNVYTTGRLSENGQSSATFNFTSSDSSTVPLPLYANEFFVARYDTSGILKQVAKSGYVPGWVGSLIPNNLIIDHNQNFIISGTGEKWNGGNSFFTCFTSTVTTSGTDGFFSKISPAYCYNIIMPVADAGPDRTKCAGDTTTIGSAAVTGNSYAWASSPAGFTSAVANPVVTPAVTTTYYLSVINTSGLIARDTVVVSTAVSPAANAGPDQNICTGASATLGAAAVTGNVYSWTSSPAGFTSAISNPAVSPLINTIYYLTVTNTGGCVKKDTAVITVNTALIPAVSIAVADTNICAGATVTFTATVVNGGSNPVYQWQVNGANAGTNSSTFTTNTLPAGNSTVKVTVTSSASCAVPPAATSNSIVMHANAVTPGVTVSASATTICAGAAVTFTATPVNGGTSPVYQWKKNGAVVGTNSASYISSTLANGDVITVSLTSNAACASPATVTGQGITITVTPAAGITISGTTTVQAGLPAAITSVTSNAGATQAYQWQDSTVIHSWVNISGATNPVINYTPAVTGDKLRCKLTAANTCTPGLTAFSNVLTFTVDTALHGKSGVIAFYPNPVHQKLTIDSLLPAMNWQTVTVISINGAQQNITQIISGQTKVVIETGNLPAGVYMAILRNKNDETAYFKFLKL